MPAILVASVATGFAGALFNPAVRAYLAADSGDRRVGAFAVFNVFYQAGILAGPPAMPWAAMLTAPDSEPTAEPRTRASTSTRDFTPREYRPYYRG